MGMRPAACQVEPAVSWVRSSRTASAPAPPGELVQDVDADAASADHDHSRVRLHGCRSLSRGARRASRPTLYCEAAGRLHVSRRKKAVVTCITFTPVAFRRARVDALSRGDVFRNPTGSSIPRWGRLAGAAVFAAFLLGVEGRAQEAESAGTGAAAPQTETAASVERRSAAAHRGGAPDRRCVDGERRVCEGTRPVARSLAVCRGPRGGYHARPLPDGAGPDAAAAERGGGVDPGRAGRGAAGRRPLRARLCRGPLRAGARRGREGRVPAGQE